MGKLTLQFHRFCDVPRLSCNMLNRLDHVCIEYCYKVEFLYHLLHGQASQTKLKSHLERAQTCNQRISTDIAYSPNMLLIHLPKLNHLFVVLLTFPQNSLDYILLLTHGNSCCAS